MGAGGRPCARRPPAGDRRRSAGHRPSGEHAGAVHGTCAEIPDRISQGVANAYAAPALLLLPFAPTSVPDGEIAMASPKKSAPLPPGTVSSACWVYTLPEGSNTYPAPAYVPSPNEVTATVDPDIVTTEPNSLPGAPSEAVSSGSWNQYPSTCANTYAAP